MKRFLLALASAFILCSCKTTPEITADNNNAGMEWTVSEAIDGLSGTDPIEPFNRTMFVIGDCLMNWVVCPVGWVYGSILPKEVIQRIDYASDNLAFPGRMVSCFCQAKWKGGCTELGRFLVNTTVGIGGLFDPAAYYLQWNRRPENMGHAFAYWGIGPGGLFILPLIPSTNTRDLIGFAFDSLLDLKFILPYASSVCLGNNVINSYSTYRNLTEFEQDRYDVYKNILIATRFVQVNDLPFKLKKTPVAINEKEPIFRPKGPLCNIRKSYQPQEPELDTLRAAIFSMQHDKDSWWIKTSLWNTDFSGRGKVRSVRNAPDEPEREFKFWDDRKNPHYRNELVIIIPGIGTHFTGNQPGALAEILSTSGYTVTVTSSTMNWQFAVTKDSAYPGYVPDDVQRLRKHLLAVKEYLAKEHGIKPERTIIAGISLGALQTLHLAQLESQQNLLKASRFVAINPPVDLHYAIQKFDEYSAISKKWTRQEFYENAGDILAKYLPAVQKFYAFDPVTIERDLAFTGEKKLIDQRKIEDYKLYLNADQAKVILGLNFRYSLRNLLANAARRGFYPAENLSWGGRRNYYLEADRISAMDYVTRYVMSQHKGMDISQLSYNSGLRKLEPFLKQSDKIRILHNTDDPLLSEKDKVFLDGTVGKRMCWFNAGGHLGNMYRNDWQDVFLDFVEE